MPGNGKRSKSAEVPPVPDREEAERYYHEQDGLLVHMPSEQERRVSTKRDCADETLPVRTSKQSDKADLDSRQCLSIC